MKIELRIPAPDGALFDHEAVRSQLGKTITVENGTGRVIAARVVDDRAAMVITVDVDGDPAGAGPVTNVVRGAFGLRRDDHALDIETTDGDGCPGRETQP